LRSLQPEPDLDLTHSDHVVSRSRLHHCASPISSALATVFLFPSSA